MPDLGPRYEHKEIEEKIYRLWERSGYFNPDNLPDAHKRKPYCIIMPPPNANGPLHIGHALFVTLEDIMIRYSRMRGKRTLWLPGADHAGFETQVVFDGKLEKEGRNRFTMNRDALWKEMWDFTQENKKTMEAQLRKLGASCDWSREVFTLEPRVVEQVYATFKKMHDDGLVYRDLRVVNWCPKHRTALSDLEVKYVEKTDPLYYIKYGPLTLATVRPETKFGDTALAVNPKDKRYQKYVGKTIEAKGVLGLLTFKVIADEAVDPHFGTGVVKVTPAHDQADYEIWQRHKNEIPGPKTIIGEDGRLTDETGKFKRLKVAEARARVAEAIQKIGILEKVDPNYVHQVATCYKCGSTLEPLPKPQWFVKMQPLAKKAIAAAQKIKFFPSHSKKVYLHWLKNIRDWNISRQIVWGIRIPAWFRRNEIAISAESPGPGWQQDPDVFDTWFSSGQWPFIALGFKEGGKSRRKVGTPIPTPTPGRDVGAEASEDYKTFYPTDVMETGYDILFFWVTRMVMFGLYRTGKVPFKAVYLHGLVRDKDRQKMSKSKGNVIDPLGVADTYGTDAVRMALVAGNTPGKDTAISEDKIRAYRNFATKVWNIARFILMHKPGRAVKPVLSAADRTHIAHAQKVKSQVAKHIEKFEFHLAAEKTYHYIWHTFADKIIEEYKPRLRAAASPEEALGVAPGLVSEGAGAPRAQAVGGRRSHRTAGSEELAAAENQAAAYHTLETILIECLTMLHPFMPFITEEIFRNLRPRSLLMVQPW
ncbi:MAG: valine--tRNA ligase [Candidatus Liptonbacteria bacterium RIFCSPLOWO2_01_FULL_56_20]|uniref:Valine--tRNA ligase n=1 Tax=Candidatus Liptonbacteria bacterium RIFCSPLOWO2_01_FULL_56_20 TaxID=1798652 RepID=A0A1G2CLQ7_9BACT|nr:MAG: valine--tRNA ligase [Candidatus Liptonbacteria bacterium RIFCSPLOWO2_01_FULL_56_20]